MNRMTLIVCVIGSLLSAAAHADEASVVSGTGTVVVKRIPTSVRMSIQFRETGKDLADALKNLKDRRDTSIATITKMGAIKDSIHEGEPRLAVEDAQTARVMMMNGGPGGPAKKKKPGATKVTVTGRLTAEWTLPDGRLDDLLAAFHDIQEKIQAADLAGQKGKKKLSAEEQEEQEEMEMMQQQRYAGRPETKVGEPAYIFLAKITAAEQQKATTAAFQKARANAELLAVAAGRKLGRLKGLNSHSDAGASHAYMYNRFNGDEEQEADDGDDANDDAIGKSAICAKISFPFSVQATFDIVE